MVLDRNVEHVGVFVMRRNLKNQYTQSYCASGRRSLNGQRGSESEANSAGKNKNTVGGYNVSSHCGDEKCAVHVRRIWRRSGAVAKECRRSKSVSSGD